MRNFSKAEKKKARQNREEALTLAKKPNEAVQILKDLYTDRELVKITKRIETMPPKYRIIYITALQGKSRVYAIKSFCLECICWQKDEIMNCTSPECPLFPYRPYKKPNRSK